MDKRRLSKRAFRYIITILFAVFIALYMSQSTGYMENQNRKQAALTQKQITKFEKDVAEGKKIDINTYLKTNNKNYQNKISKTGLAISKMGSSTVQTFITQTFKVIEKLNK